MEIFTKKSSGRTENNFSTERHRLIFLEGLIAKRTRDKLSQNEVRFFFAMSAVSNLRLNQSTEFLYREWLAALKMRLHLRSLMNLCNNVNYRLL